MSEHAIAPARVSTGSCGAPIGPLLDDLVTAASPAMVARHGQQA
ncbi:MAG TPA: hypothetical protein VIX85_11685 [Acidimicrobiales bacterium]